MNYRLIFITLSILSGSCFLVNNKIECATKNQLDKERMSKIEIVASECGNMEVPLNERLTQLKEKFKREKLTKLLPEQLQVVEELNKETRNGKLSPDERLEKSNGSHLLEIHNYEKNKGFRERHQNLNSIGSAVGGVAVGAIAATAIITMFNLFVPDKNYYHGERKHIFEK